MHIVHSERGAVRAASRASRRTLWAGLGLAASVAAAVAGQAQTPQQAFGEPVNLYARGVDPYAPPQGNGEIQPWHMRGRVWLIAGGESNVTVHLGDQGVFVVDTGTEAMAPKLLAQIQRLAQERGGTHKAIRMVVNTNGRLDHIGGNEIIRKAGSQIIAGEERGPQANFGSPGAEVFAHENVQARLVDEGIPQPLWPTDLEGFESDSRRFNGEPVQIYHPRSANTDGQLVVLFRESDVLVAGDVVDMTALPDHRCGARRQHRRPADRTQQGDRHGGARQAGGRRYADRPGAWPVGHSDRRGALQEHDHDHPQPRSVLQE